MNTAPGFSPRMRFSLSVLGAFLILALGADFFAPYGESEQYRAYFYAPPTPVHFFDRQGVFHRRPFVYRMERITEDGTVRYVENTEMAFPIQFGVRGRPYRLVGLIPWDRHLLGVPEPAHLFLLGCDELGRDVFSRLLFGAQVSLALGLLVTALSVPLGVAVGSLAGYYGGRWVDTVLMRLTDLFLALPGLYLVLALRSAFPLEFSAASPEALKTRLFFMLALILSFLGWSSMARPVRGLVLSLRERDFITAARALGASDGRILAVHVLPNLSGFVLVQATLAIPAYLLAEIALSYLGLGIPEPYASWGRMLAGLQHGLDATGRWWMWSPAAAVFLVVLAFNQLGDALSPRAGR